MAREPLKILCFGDSLTAGYSKWGMKMTPYATAMKTFLEQQLADGEADVEVCVEGVSGERVTGGMVDRMEKSYAHKSAKDDPFPFTWLIFLGGTNDIGWGKPVDEIWDAILKVTDIPRRRRGAAADGDGEGAGRTPIKVLMCTVPECHVKREWLDEKRDDLNGRIRGDEREGVYIFDLHQKVPYHALPPAERALLWDDGLHFSEEGYQRIGELIGQRLLGIIERGQGRIESEDGVGEANGEAEAES